jgi:hypothetical protein
MRSWSMGFLLMKKGKAEGFIRRLRGSSTYNLKVYTVSYDARALRFQEPGL